MEETRWLEPRGLEWSLLAGLLRGSRQRWESRCSLARERGVSQQISTIPRSLALSLARGPFACQFVRRHRVSMHVAEAPRLLARWNATRE